jgi:dipeptidyl aminopeptidase/acylaminoacyl peptidase
MRSKSYGGFMSSKVVEAGAGIHSLAMAVAPVTSWRLYGTFFSRLRDMVAEWMQRFDIHRTLHGVTTE